MYGVSGGQAAIFDFETCSAEKRLRSERGGRVGCRLNPGECVVQSTGLGVAVEGLMPHLFWACS